MLLILGRIGMSVLTLFFVIWIVLEWINRANSARVVNYESGVGDVKDNSLRSMGWKLHLGMWLGIPAVAILWGLVI